MPKCCWVRIDPVALGQLLHIPPGAHIRSVRMTPLEYGPDNIEVFITGYGYPVKEGDLTPQLPVELTVTPQITVHWPTQESFATEETHDA